MADGPRILFVDDDGIFVELLTVMLSEYGIEVEPVGTVSGTRAALDPHRHAAVVTDWHLADGLGPDVADVVRTVSETLPIIFLSGNPTDEMRGKARAFGPLAFLGKNDLPAARIADLLAARPAAAAASGKEGNRD